MDKTIYEKLYQEGFLSNDSYTKIKSKESNPLFSVHWELKTLLYLGVMLLSTGLGVLIYKNIDTIGHQVILALIAAISFGCFAYCLKKKHPFSFDKVSSPNSFFDYILLLGCLSFLTFVGYLQFQYEVFGTRYGMATFIPMLVLFFVAYYFDHLGILSLAITNLGLWMGIAVTPTQILANNDFNSDQIIYSGLLLGIILLLAAFLSERYNIKKHFKFTYQNFGLNLTFIALLAGYYSFGSSTLLWIVALAAIALFYYKEAIREHSFYFLLVITLYGYIAISSVIIRGLIALADEGAIYLGLMYFIASGIGVILFLINLNKKLKKHDHLQ
ncbi:DUF2157 domain-containing protein [Solitalea sp. MAHUQ-68]|uniref:DUF2157 domain-containing protein n=1 Tax=Solitalea agri TaxID=2953739 RepID=A0A9X2JCV1_9SPHI|nr:DUF2157 domain-containing protein [Solitalea agri]MCO4292180.1 DUF2157 domain-containing protein [Solitalea agri]